MFKMRKNSRTIAVNDLIKCILLLNMCRTIISDADPKFGGDIYLKMCSVLKIPRFCLSYMMGSNPYPFYALPLPAPVPLPIAPFPLIVSPTSSIASFTIPTVFTTNRPGGAPMGGAPMGGAQPPPPSGSQCPPSPVICPPAALAMPIIDPRQGSIPMVATFN